MAMTGIPGPRPLRPLTLGGLIEEMLRLYQQNFVSLIAIVAIVQVAVAVVAERLQRRLDAVGRVGRDRERQLDRPAQVVRHVVQVVVAARAGDDERHLLARPLPREPLVVVHVCREHRVGQAVRLLGDAVEPEWGSSSEMTGWWIATSSARSFGAAFSSSTSHARWSSSTWPPSGTFVYRPTIVANGVTSVQ